MEVSTDCVCMLVTILQYIQVRSTLTLDKCCFETLAWYWLCFSGSLWVFDHGNIWTRSIITSEGKAVKGRKSMKCQVRDGCRQQNGWIFGKVPNGRWPPPPSFSENHAQTSAEWVRLFAEYSSLWQLLINNRHELEYSVNKRTRSAVDCAADCHL